jgi:hypothetical protein
MCAAAAPAALVVAVVASSSATEDALSCSFDKALSSTVQVVGLTQDYTAYNADDCKSNCCSDAVNKCTVWQFSQGVRIHSSMHSWAALTAR